MNLRRPDHIDDDDWNRLQAELGKFQGGNLTPQALQNASPDQLGNSVEMELKWAQAAGEFADTHWATLCVTRDVQTELRLTSVDRELYEVFRGEFPDWPIDVYKAEMTKKEKLKWGALANRYKAKIKDFNFGTLLRVDSSKGYDAENTCVVVRVLWFMIEVARNIEGHNNAVCAGPAESSSSSS